MQWALTKHASDVRGSDLPNVCVDGDAGEAHEHPSHEAAHHQHAEVDGQGCKKECEEGLAEGTSGQRGGPRTLVDKEGA